MVIPIILCGGSGTRLWPLSQADKPKPFLPLFKSDLTLFQQALQRAALFAPPLVICQASHLTLVQKQSKEMGTTPRTIILEPHPQGTAAAMAIACLQLKSTFEDATLLVLPSDLVIHNHQAFKAAVDLAIPYAQNSQNVTFGIKPTRPEPRYGYIETTTKLEENVFKIQRFTEKPSMETAVQWVTEQKYFWNSGVLVLSLQKVVSTLNLSQPMLMQACIQALKNGSESEGIISLDDQSFSQAPSLSFEKAIIEQFKGIMVQADFDWSDAGTWQSLWELQANNPLANVCHGKIRVQDSTGCYIHSTTKRISVLGCDDLVIVETADEVLVTTRKMAEGISEFVQDENHTRTN